MGIHRKLVDAAREFQMLQDGSPGGCGENEASPDHNDDVLGLLLQEPDTTEKQWQKFVEQESQKR